MKTTPSIKTVAFLGNYVPRKCGIATFTSDLLGAVAARHPQSRCFAVAVNDTEEGYRYPGVVRFQIEEQDPESYLRAADDLNTSNVDVVSLQHEFGIYGGPAGSHLLTLLRELKAPVVTTLHTVLRQPNAEQYRVMQKLIVHSTRLVVMTERGQSILHDVYQAPLEKIDLIPHGIPDVPFVAPDHYKGQFGLAGKKVLLTFGLLSPNKGIEQVLHALPEVVAEFPDLVYIVLGATHPNELRVRGETYRLGLEAITRENKLENNVIFHNRFVELKELTEFIGAADLYVTPYLDEAQITSGTLAYAFGAGKAVISTPYWHATELLRDQRGVLVPFADPKAIAHEVSGLLRDETRRLAMSDRAYALGREMVWSNTARLYMRSFDQARRQAAGTLRVSAAANGLSRRTHTSSALSPAYLHYSADSTGPPRHVSLIASNPAAGCGRDHNAGAIIPALLFGQVEEASRRTRAPTAYAAFLKDSFDAQTTRFRNSLSVDYRWLDEPDGENSHRRTIPAVGTPLGPSPKLLVTGDLNSPTAWASIPIGIHTYLRRQIYSRLAQDVRSELARHPFTIFDKLAAPSWYGFEMSRSIGGSGFFTWNDVHADFDRQAIEVQTMLSACLEAFRATADPWWYEQAQRAYAWFFDWNDLELELCCPWIGDCRDPLHPNRSNENQGAESMLAGWRLQKCG